GGGRVRTGPGCADRKMAGKQFFGLAGLPEAFRGGARRHYRRADLWLDDLFSLQAGGAHGSREDNPMTELIDLRGVEKVYGDGKHARVVALNAIDLSIAKGEFVAISGPSGSGKSTLLHILGCLDQPTAGTYLLGGQNTSRLCDKELSLLRNRRIGFVFQAFQLLQESSALENVMLPLIYRGVPYSVASGQAREALG